MTPSKARPRIAGLFLLPAIFLAACADRAPEASATDELEPAPSLVERDGRADVEADGGSAADGAPAVPGPSGTDRSARTASAADRESGAAAPTSDDDPGRDRASAGEASARAASAGAPASAPPPPPPVRVPERRPVFERPEHVRGIYLNASAAGSPARLEAAIRLAHETEVNAFVIDVKEGPGRISWPSAVPEAREAGAAASGPIEDPAALLRRLEEEGIWPIARIVVAKDDALIAHRPELAIQDTAGGVWVDSNGFRWTNPFHPDVYEYNMAVAREAAALGFPEIQWDYIRFPDAPRADLLRAVYPGRDGRSRPSAIRDFLRRSRDELSEDGVLVTADVFGATTSAADIGIGQVWEEFIDVVDVALPMVYPSHYWPGAFGFEDPPGRPYEIVRRALEHAVRRSEAIEGAGLTRPWLQDFALYFPDDRVPDVRAQIQATYDAGIHEWILWNPSSRYTREALAPAGGWRPGTEPPIRLAGRVVDVDERFAVLERVAREARRRAEREAEEDADEDARDGETRVKDRPPTRR